MNRTPKLDAPALQEIKPTKKAGYIIQTRTYKLITPLFGGGEDTQKADSITTVRATEVRGHLRFWWRATRGGAEEFEGKLENMKKREEDIWGSAAGEKKPGPSEVKIFINKNTLEKGVQFQAVDRVGHNIRNIGHPNSKDGYVAFPLRDSPNPIVWENVVFDMQIQYPRVIKDNIKIEDDIKEALWAWETFGGIGARTRRGFGALKLTHVDGVAVPETSVKSTRQAITNKLDKYNSNKYKWPRGVPHLTNNSERYRFISDVDDKSAWRFVVKKLRNFRQSFRYPDRNGRPFGRNKWPEPDQIRRETGDFVNPRHTPRNPVQKFPRAKFGLPIIFEFKDTDVAAGDPQKTTLHGIKLDANKYIDRLASPLILRPIACSDGAIGLALILEWEPINANDELYTPPGGLLLRGEHKDYSPLKSDISPSEASNIPPLAGEPDVLQAFLNYLDR